MISDKTTILDILTCVCTENLLLSFQTEKMAVFNESPVLIVVAEYFESHKIKTVQARNSNAFRY